MTRLARQLHNGPFWVLALAGSMVSCREDVPLGAWNLPPIPSGQGGSTGTTTVGTMATTGGGTGGGTGGDAGAPPVMDELAPLPACNAAGNPEPVNAAGADLDGTNTATDWTWPEPVESVEFDLMVEKEVEQLNRGAYWAYQFSFLEGASGAVEGASGWFGMQAEGVYQEDPSDMTMTEITKIAVFWLSGTIDAELGDIPFPDARIAPSPPSTPSGVEYQTIHARFDWQPCHVYRFRLAPHSSEDDGSVWYGAWIEDLDAQDVTFLGRMLLPADSGALSPFSTSRTLEVSYSEPTACFEAAQASAIFGTPHNVEGDVIASEHSNRFSEPFGCPSSRFTEFEDAVRHEIGVPP